MKYVISMIYAIAILDKYGYSNINFKIKFNRSSTEFYTFLLNYINVSKLIFANKYCFIIINFMLYLMISIVLFEQLELNTIANYKCN